MLTQGTGFPMDWRQESASKNFSPSSIRFEPGTLGADAKHTIATMVSVLDRCVKRFSGFHIWIVETTCEAKKLISQAEHKKQLLR